MEGSSENSEIKPNPPEKKRLKKIQRKPSESSEFELDEEDFEEEDLAHLTHLEKEKILADQHQKKEDMIKKKKLKEELKKNKNELTNDLLNYSLTKRGLSILKDESQDFTERQAPLNERTKSIKKPKKQTEEKNIISNENINLLNKICMTRTFLFQIHKHLYFENAVKNCLVKIHVGNSSGQNNYKIGIIKRVLKKEEQYEFEGKMYNIYLEVANENNLNWEVKLCNVSNQEIDWPEGYKLLDKLRNVVNFELDMNWVNKKIEELNKFMNYKFTSDDILRIKEKQLAEKMPETEEEFLSKKKLLETKLNILEDENFRCYSRENENEIKALKDEIREIKYFLDKKQKVSEKNFLKSFNQKDKYLKFKNIKKEERVIFERNTEKPLNMWTIDQDEIKIEYQKENLKKMSNSDINQINQKIYNDLMNNFLSNFQRNLPIDDLIEHIEV